MPELVTYLNQFMTDEIFVTDIEIMPDGFKNSMSLLIAADYMVVEKEAGVFPENWQEKWLSFMEQQEIVIEKKTKKSVKEVDIKPHILAWDFSMDAFAVSICKGLSLGKIKPKHMCIAGAWFGGFQALMPLIGYYLGSLFADMVTRYSHWVAFALLLAIGGNMIKESLGEEENVSNDMGFKSMLLLAIATSIDALAVGVSLAFLKVAILPAVLFIGCITFVCSAAGVKIGSIFGDKYQSKAELCGGIILILIGIKILLDGLGIL